VQLCENAGVHVPVSFFDKTLDSLLQGD